MRRRRFIRFRLPPRGPRGNVGALPALLLAVGLLLCFFAWVNRQLRPVLEALALSQVHNAVTASINDAVTAGIAAEDVSYDDMVTLETDGAGRITALKSNMAQVNRLRSLLLGAALEQVSELSTRDFSIPVGNLTGLDFLSGWGPGIRVDLLTAGAADAAFHNEFSSAGVNQTLHRIVLEVHVTMHILLPGETVETQVSTQVCVAETVIVGQVPETYLQLEGGS